jgi:hypothetical protein
MVALRGNRTPDVGHNSGSTDFSDAEPFARLDVKSIVITTGSIKTGKATRAHVPQFGETTERRKT